MKHTIEIVRDRFSVTQGSVSVKFDGKTIATYADEIKLIGSDDYSCGAKGRPTYGENIGGWASIHSDEHYLIGLFADNSMWGVPSVAERITVALKEQKKRGKKEVAA